MTTEDTNFEHSDVEEVVAEYQPVPETTPTSDEAHVDEHAVKPEEQGDETTAPTHTAVTAN